MKHYYCKDCLYYNGIEKIDKCLSCSTDKNISFFFEIDISEQIKFMFENLKLYEKLNSSLFDSDKNITDIIDGSEYIRVNVVKVWIERSQGSETHWVNPVE